MKYYQITKTDKHFQSTDTIQIREYIEVRRPERFDAALLEMGIAVEHEIASEVPDAVIKILCKGICEHEAGVKAWRDGLADKPFTGKIDPYTRAMMSANTFVALGDARRIISKYDGVCDLSGQEFTMGAEILYKRQQHGPALTVLASVYDEMGNA
jgi:hypothetical protein